MIKNFDKFKGIIWLGVGLIFIGIINFFQVNKYSLEKEIILSEFLSKLHSNQIQSIQIRGNKISGAFVDSIGGGRFRTYGAMYTDVIKEAKGINVAIEVLPISSKTNTIISAAISLAPMILLVLFWFFVTRQMQGGSSKAFGLIKSKAKLQPSTGPKVTFADVAGIDEAKDELSEMVEFLKDPIKFHKLGGTIPRGCLLTGPPGTGKTLLAKAIAGEANVPFFSISGSDFIEMFVGIGASRVRDMFEEGKKNSPCIIFIDEIDAVGRSRGSGMSASHEEREQTLNQLLVEMDGFKPNEGIIIIAATNRPDVLDRALLRPGRFDRQISISHPDIKGRENILKVHLKKVKHSKEIDVKTIARGTPGFTGADLKNLVNESALLAAKRGKNMVDNTDIEDAKDKVLMGIEKKSAIISDERKKLTAYHESGHAIVSLYVKRSDPIHKITVIPRGRALGMVLRLPEDDQILASKLKIESDIRVAMGGRAAEEIIFGKNEITSGASSDIKMATKYAKAMVMEWGMSEKLGTIFFDNSDMYSFYSQDSDGKYSSKTASLIDEEVKKIIENAYKDAKKILTDHLDELKLLAEVLIEKETLTGKEVIELINSNKEKTIQKSN